MEKIIIYNGIFNEYTLTNNEYAYVLDSYKEAVINKGINSMCRIGSNDVIPIAMKLVAL